MVNKISIITVCFNAEKLIEMTMNSLKTQSYPNIEYIIIDGNSTDNTINIIKKNKIIFGNQLILISEKDNGIYDALNKGIRLAKGDLIGILHAGDLLSDRNVLYSIVNEFNKEECDVLYGNTICFLPNNINKIVRIDRGGQFNKKNFLSGWMPSHPTVYCKKKIFNQVGFYNTKYKIGADYEFLLRLMFLNNFKIHYYDRNFYKYALGGTSSSSIRNILLANYECKNAWIENKLNPPKFFIFKKLLRKIPQFLKALIYKY